MSAISNPYYPPRPLRDLRPTERGGPIARRGFAYQDDIAARFALQMLGNPRLTEVWCESHDDVVLVWQQPDATELVEFVQVKNEEIEQLYSPARLMERDGKEGSSIYERSIAHDCCKEDVCFRLVSTRQLKPELSVLAVDWRDTAARSKLAQEMQALLEELSQKPAGCSLSPRGRGLPFWLNRGHWEVCSRNEASLENCRAIGRFLENAGVEVYSDTVEEIYQNLLGWVKSAGEADPVIAFDRKVIRRSALAFWLMENAQPKHAGTEKKLREKLTNAFQPPEAIMEAIDLRRDYVSEMREPKFLALDETKIMTRQVRGVLQHARSQMVAGDIPDGAEFHRDCASRVIAVREDCPTLSKKPDQGLLLGCMYDVTARCRHRFVRSTP